LEGWDCGGASNKLLHFGPDPHHEPIRNFNGILPLCIGILRNQLQLAEAFDLLVLEVYVLLTVYIKSFTIFIAHMRIANLPECLNNFKSYLSHYILWVN